MTNLQENQLNWSIKASISEAQCVPKLARPEIYESQHSADTDPSKIDPRLSPKKFSNVDDQPINLSILAEKLAPTTSDIRPY